MPCFSAHRRRTRMRARALLPMMLPALLLALATANLTGCGGAPAGEAEPGLGTLSIRNATDEGALPFDVLELYVQPTGTTDTSGNLLVQPIPPGGLVIVGRFPEGLYDVLAIVEGPFALPFNFVLLRADQPTTLEVRFD